MRRFHSFDTTGTILEGFHIVPALYKSEKYRRNRLTAALRFAKPQPLLRPIVNPITNAALAHFPRLCRTCGRPFFERPKAPQYKSSPVRKYCTPMCQVLRPKGFDQWLERVIMRVWWKGYQIDSGSRQLEDGTLQHREISTDQVQAYIMKHHGKHFQHGMPLMFMERIRAAARRLVALPERSKKVGKGWQAIAITERTTPNPGEDKWEQIPLAPDRGNIMLRLIKHQKESKNEEPVKVSAAVVQRIRAHLVRRKTINGKELVDLPEWQGKYWFDEAGRIHGIQQKERLKKGHALVVHEEGRLDGVWTEIQRAKLEKRRRNRMASPGWTDLLNQNQDIIDQLTKERNAILGLGE
jgi:hypothetical protein